MEFFTVSHEARPIRLSESTRRFARDSLVHRYGQDTAAVDAAILDHVSDLREKTAAEQYHIAISEIVRQARIRICPGELISGAATFGWAIRNLVPASYHGEPILGGSSHLTLDFGTVLTRGVNGIMADIREKMAEPGLTDRQVEFLHSCVHSLTEMWHWRDRYIRALSGDPAYAATVRHLSRVPFEPANHFHEAVQSLWFTFAFTRLCGHWPGIGRLDVLLGDYLKRDLADGVLTLDEAREILAHFFIKGCEWITGEVTPGGDAQHYQNIVLSGIDEDGNDVTNEVTYLVLDILEEMNIGDFPTSVRLNRHSDEKLLRRVAEVMKHGGGVLAIYNEETVILAMTKHGYDLRAARRFANDGCWEMQVPGETNFSYIPFDGLKLLLIHTLHLDGEPAHFSDYASLRAAFFAVLERAVSDMYRESLRYNFQTDERGQWTWREHVRAIIPSIFEKDCIQHARDYFEGGTRYLVVSPHLGGAADVGNSLRAIDVLCFRDKIVSFDDLMRILKNDWAGEEALRRYAQNKISYYGNDDDEADAYTVDVVNTFAEIVLRQERADYPLRFVPGVSTFGRQVEWSHDRPATPHGFKRGAILAPNMAATPGTDPSGATALIRSYCKIDLEDQVTGAALDLKLLPACVKGEAGTEALVGLMRGFVALGGCFMQPDIVDNDILRRAQEHPEDYASLSVRVSGWNARFVTLDKEWQDMCIEKTTQGVW